MNNEEYKTCFNCGEVVHGEYGHGLCDICDRHFQKNDLNVDRIKKLSAVRLEVSKWAMASGINMAEYGPEVLISDYFKYLDSIKEKTEFEEEYLIAAAEKLTGNRAKYRFHASLDPRIAPDHCGKDPDPSGMIVHHHGAEYLKETTKDRRYHFIVDREKIVSIVPQKASSNEMFTPSRYAEKARRTMGSITTDPASCDVAQKTIMADVYHTIDDDGLQHPWRGNIFMNPPYSRGMMPLFMDKLYSEIDKKNTLQAVVIANAQTAARWFQKACRRAAACCFVSPRISFIDGGTLKEKKGNDRSQVIFYFGDNIESFKDEFHDVGAIMVWEEVPCKM
jgi:phage N-6-adenine-methyltransferase